MRNSASALSDLEEGINDGHTSDDTLDPSLRGEGDVSIAPPKATVSTRNPASVVSEPKHVPSSKFRMQANNTFGNMSEYMKIKMESEEKKVKAMEVRLDLDQAKLALEKQKVEADLQRTKIEMARQVFAMEGASEQVKDAANTYLLSLFQ